MADIVPHDFKYIDPDLLHFHQPRFDVGRMATGLNLLSPFTLSSNVTGTHKPCFATEGFPVGSGLHTWSVEVLDMGPNKYIMIGVAGDDCALTTSTFPGTGGNKGVSYYLGDGHRYFSNTHTAFGPVGTANCIVRVLLDMNSKTCSFYVNGIRIGMAAGPDVLTSAVYYPVLTLYEMGATVTYLEVPEVAMTTGAAQASPRKAAAQSTSSTSSTSSSSTK